MFLNVNSTYITSNVSTTAGAFVGHLAGGASSSINRCFAAGSVIAQSNSTGILNTGGLIGLSGQTAGTTIRSVQNSAALGASITATGRTISIGRIYGRIVGTEPSPYPIANNRAYNGMKVYQSSIYGDGNPAELTAVPFMSASPILQLNSITDAAIGGDIFIGGSGPVIVTITAETCINEIIGIPNPLPVWNGSSVTGIDLSGFITDEDYLIINFNLRDHLGNSADYNIQIYPNDDTFSDFSLNGPWLESSSFIVTSDIAGQHGADTHLGQFRDRTFWGNNTGTVGLLFNSSTNWDFSTVEARGYPVLRGSLSGPMMGGQ